MVVVLPAPLGPSRPKHSPRAHLEVEAVDRHDVAVALDQRAAGDGGVAHLRLDARRSVSSARRMNASAGGGEPAS